MYITDTYTYNTVPDRLKLWNSKTNTTEFTNVPITSQILNLPKRVCVLICYLSEETCALVPYVR